MINVWVVGNQIQPGRNEKDGSNIYSHRIEEKVWWMSCNI